MRPAYRYAAVQHALTMRGMRKTIPITNAGASLGRGRPQN